MNLENIILLQSLVRGFLVRNNVLVIPSYIQTKDWRKKQKWYYGGKKNECEIYQRNLIEQITNNKCEKTNERIKMCDYKIYNKNFPLKEKDGFEYTEDFDGKILHNNNKCYYYNLKFICDDGGAQTRSLREVYHFVKVQLEYLLLHKTQNIYFINILDGNTSYKYMDKFIYLLHTNEKYNIIKNFMFIGDLYDFQKWWNKIIK